MRGVVNVILLLQVIAVFDVKAMTDETLSSVKKFRQRNTVKFVIVCKLAFKAMKYFVVKNLCPPRLTTWYLLAKGTRPPRYP
jgi:hypothetical protein